MLTDKQHKRRIETLLDMAHRGIRGGDYGELMKELGAISEFCRKVSKTSGKDETAMLAQLASDLATILAGIVPCIAEVPPEK